MTDLSELKVVGNLLGTLVRIGEIGWLLLSYHLVDQIREPNCNLILMIEN